MSGLSIDDKARHFTRLSQAIARLDKARERVRREQDVLDQIVAELVSSKPMAETWYLHPGDLTPAEVQAGASLTELQLHRCLERYRQRFSDKPAAKKRRRS